MYVSEVKNINFGAKTFNVVKQVRSKEAVVQLTGDVPSQVVAMVSSIEKLHGALRKLEVQKSNPQAQNCLEVLKTQHGYRGLLETKADGIVLAGDDGKNLIVSSHGVNALRMREQNVQTGEIESSIFIHDKKVAKTDTKHEIPKEIEDLRHTDIGYQFGGELQTKLDDADYALVRVRRALSAPEFQAEIAKVEPVQILPVNVKPRKVVEVVEKPEVASPAPVEKPAVKRDMDEKRIALVNSLLSEPKKPVKTPVVERAVDKKELPSNPLVDLILSDVPKEAPVKRRGRPKGSVNKPKIEQTVQKQSKPQVENVEKEVPTTSPKAENSVVQAAPKPQAEKIEKTVQPEQPQKVEKPVQAKSRKRALIPTNLLSDEETALIGEVKSEFKRVYTTLSSRGVSKNTRSAVKNGYGEKLLKDKTCSRILNFIGIGQEGTNVGINVLEVKDGDFLHLRLTDKNNKVKNVIVDPQGRVTRRSVAANIKESEEKNNAYTRQELDELELVPLLKKLKGELGEYNTYVEARLEKAEKRKNAREEGIKRNAEAKQELKPQQMMKFIQDQINQVRIELTNSLRLMTAEITSAASKSFRTFGETANSKLNELQENLMKFVDKR